MYNALRAALHSLAATGSSGFEGLIQNLIGRLTGHRFFLAKSGAQRGKDAATAGYGDTYVDIECKRYDRGTSPMTRELCGGLMEAIAASGGRLDLWLVVSTGAIGSVEAEALRQLAEREAVAVEIIDWQEAQLPELAVLCAAFSDEVLSELRARRAQADFVAAASDLKAIRDDSTFSSRLQDLRSRLSEADVGLDQAHAAANAWIDSRLTKKSDAIAAFGQALCVGDPTFQRYVERRTPEAALSEWYDAWSAQPTVAVVVGHEGNGKSWTTMAWWRGLRVRPLTLLITSNRDIGNDASALLGGALARQTARRDRTFWERRLEQWLQLAAGRLPTVLLILDGLNERRREPWDALFASLADSRFVNRVAVIATCRPSFWSEEIAPFLPEDVRTTRINIPPFDDEELAAAWGPDPPSITELPQPVRDFIRTPRILRLARSRVDRLTASGDLTVERLLVEDWADRRRLKRGFAHSEADFNNLIISLARDLRQGVVEFQPERLRAYSSLARRSPDRDLDKDFDEIIEGQLFEQVNPPSDRFRVRAQHVGLALGMLLAHEAKEAFLGSGQSGVEHLIATSIDPVADFDQTAASLRGACAVSLIDSRYPREVRRMLLGTWLRLRNLADDHWHDFAAYVPLHPPTFFGLAEEFWSDGSDYPNAREWIGDALLRWRRHTDVAAEIQRRCSRWLGLWHPQWPRMTSRRAEELARHRRSIDDNLRCLTAPQSRLPKELVEEASTPDAPSIARLALLLISYGPRLPHVRGFVAWALSRAITALPDEFDVVAWCLRLNDVDPQETEAALLAEADRLLEDASELGTRAARYLLAACSTPGAAVRLARLPPPRSELWVRPRPEETDPLDPSSSPPAALVAKDSLAALDIDALRISLGMTAEDHQLEQIEPMLARFAPVALAGFYRRLLQTASDRHDVRLRQLGWEVPKHLLLLTEDEERALDQARRGLFAKLGATGGDHAITEAYILMGVHSRHQALEQAHLLIERPAASQDLWLFEHVFASMPDEIANGLLGGAVDERPPHELRRLLWLVGQSGFQLSPPARQALVRCFGHPDALVRASAFRVAVACSDSDALQAHLSSGWSAAGDEATLEAFYGSRALIAAADPASYETLRARVSLDLLGYLASRDARAAAISAFADDLDELWRAMARAPGDAQAAVLGFEKARPTSQDEPKFELAAIRPEPERPGKGVKVVRRRPSTSDIDAFFGRQDLQSYIDEQREFQERIRTRIVEARQAGRRLFGRRMRDHGIGAVVVHRPDLVEKWVDWLTQNPSAGWDTLEFYGVLSSALAATSPDRAADIVRSLRRGAWTVRVVYGPLDVDSVTWLALQLPSTQTVDALREEILEEADTDEFVFQIALAAQVHGSIGWLHRVIRRDVKARGLRTPARALTLIGFLDEGEVLESLRPELRNHTGFLAEVARWAENRLQQNARARGWFSEVLARRDPVEAWAAFRLFLRCVDRRFYLWKQAACDASADLPALWRQHIEVNDQDIRRAAEKNEGRLSESLFGHRIARDEIAPWYRTPRAVET